MKYIVAAIGFALVWFVVAFVIGLIVVMIIKPDAPVMVGIGYQPHNLAGTLLGFLAGLHSARASIRIANKKSEKKRSTPERSAPTQ